MKAIVVITPNFQKETKKLAKKYRSLKGELSDLISSLENEPSLGIKITENTYKIRLAVKSKGKGKSGGLRVITYLHIKIEDKISKVFMLSIYDKSDFENISNTFLTQLIAEIHKKIELEDDVPPTTDGNSDKSDDLDN